MARMLTLRNPANRESGFTLIELLVSLTILTAILGLLSTSLKVLSRNWNSNSERIEKLEMVSRAFDIFARDVSGLQRLVHQVGETRRYIFSGTQSQLSFVTLEPPYPTHAGPYFVKYSARTNGSSSELLRARAPYRMRMQIFPGATPANTVPLLQGRFKYQFSYARKAPGSTWLSSWTTQYELPDLIRLQVIDADRGTLISAPFVVAVRANAELPCLTLNASACSAKTDGRLGGPEVRSGNQQRAAK